MILLFYFITFYILLLDRILDLNLKSKAILITKISKVGGTGPIRFQLKSEIRLPHHQ